MLSGLKKCIVHICNWSTSDYFLGEIDNNYIAKAVNSQVGEILWYFIFIFTVLYRYFCYFTAVWLNFPCMGSIKYILSNRGNNAWNVFPISLRSVICVEWAGYQLVSWPAEQKAVQAELMSNIQLCTRYKNYSLIKLEHINWTDILMSDWIH